MKVIIAVFTVLAMIMSGYPEYRALSVEHRMRSYKEEQEDNDDKLRGT